MPDVVGLELGTALERLKHWRCTLRFTAPPRPRGEKGAVRVIACRRPGPGQVMEVICAREYWDRAPGRAPKDGDGPDGGHDPAGNYGAVGEGGDGGREDG